MTSALAISGPLVVMTAGTAVAQEPGTRVPVPHQQQITANPFGIIAGWFNVEYERKIAETWSVGLGGSRLSLDGGDAFNSVGAGFEL